MFNRHSILAIIPARGGSKSIKRKNIKDLNGKPLIAWAIEEGKKSRYIDRMILSSEDDEIIAIAEEYGCEVPFKRPKKYAGDKTPGILPVFHALNTLKENYNYVVLLQPTSPLRTVSDIDGAIKKCIKAGANSCVSVVEVDKHPAHMYYMDDFGMEPVTKEKYVCRQDMPKVYITNGAVYVADTKWLLQQDSFIGEGSVGYIMPPERSVDIDTISDFELVEKIMEGWGE